MVLHFYLLGYSPLQVAMPFLFYEVFGIVTNLVGGRPAARIGMGQQVVALGMPTTPDTWLSVPFVTLAQAPSGIAKDPKTTTPRHSRWSG